MKFVLSEMAAVCAAGNSPHEIFANIVAGKTDGLAPCENAEGPFFGAVKAALPKIENPHYATRCNQLLAFAAEQMRDALARLRERYSAPRIGIVLGGSNTGSEEALSALRSWAAENARPKNFSLSFFEEGAPAEFLQKYLEFSGPAYSVSTACSASAKAFVSARNLLEKGICDAVVVGGADSFCRLALEGFRSLQVLSKNKTNPMSANRDGITLGEGAALFIMEREEDGSARGKIALLGAGESSDAYHLTAPQPDGNGAKSSMLAALADANLSPEKIDLICLHGTGTLHNDAMESRAVFKIFGEKTPCTATKAFSGHALGAAGALASAMAWLAIKRGNATIPHAFDGMRDSSLPPIRLAKIGDAATVRNVMCNLFAFGGSNATLIFGRCQ